MHEILQKGECLLDGFLLLLFLPNKGQLHLRIEVCFRGLKDVLALDDAFQIDVPQLASSRACSERAEDLLLAGRSHLILFSRGKKVVGLLEREKGLDLEGELRLLRVDFKHFLLGNLLRVHPLLAANIIALRKL